MRTGFAIRMLSEDSSHTGLYVLFKPNYSYRWVEDPADATLFETAEMATDRAELIGGWAPLEISYIKYEDNGKIHVKNILQLLDRGEEDGRWVGMEGEW